MVEANKEIREGIWSWAKFYRKGWDYFAFTMHRISGIVILFYLYLHYIVLSNLLHPGPNGIDYNKIVTSITVGPYDSFLVLDFLLALVIFYHGANGVRLALNEFGIGLNKNKALFIIFEVISMILLGLFDYYALQFAGVKF
ncbi:succinate dehydrogenase cytochrome b subunit [Thermoplasma volcanium GSS1]|uniref:Succinate dehydrogenase cytochrome b subunit n=1 Tax=Thermoplasma volcanium (strain ATCC 51530 / DSM 4299 / JCM 9571 / NBRC 15438 / GSS1) TaxID=273116 RepID=Q97AQ3_THEVO|nr:succinate dehydrogenase [Thermoplasma volcanium]BAB59898.1 succinate dehydrogenase cytochrome b subunit [Thermoplasma volcanium GSS1]